MSMFSLALTAIAVSALAILALCVGDPKRRRAGGGATGGMSTGRRWLLVAIACVPGLACAVIGDPAAFLMWLGGCALIGWAFAVGFRARSVGE